VKEFRPEAAGMPSMAMKLHTNTCRQKVQLLPAVSLILDEFASCTPCNRTATEFSLNTLKEGQLKVFIVWGALMPQLK